MKVTIISYSLTGNNEALATSIAEELAAEHIKISESKPRTKGTIILDLLFNRTPRVNPVAGTVQDNDLLIFVGPVWIGHVATPLRAYFRNLRDKPGQYAFISISGGADGANLKLAGELNKRVGRAPAALIDLHIVDLLPSHPKPNRKDTSSYRLNERDVKSLTNTVMKALRGTVAKQTAFT